MPVCNKFTRKQIDGIRGTIPDQCNTAFLFIEPNAEQEASYIKWNDILYREQIRMHQETTQEIFTEFKSNMYGLNVDMGKSDNSPKGCALFGAKIKETFEQSYHAHQQSNHQKPEKQQAREEALLAGESLKVKNIGSI